MNTLHYPDLQRCKKLTELWFPETESHEIEYEWNFEEGLLVKPSVMELLDELPEIIGKNWNRYYLYTEWTTNV